MMNGHLKLIHILCHGHLVLRDTVRLIEKFLLDGRLMVAEHNENGRLSLCREVVDQLFEGLIGLIGERQILLCLGVRTRLVGELHFGGVILNRVAAVVLNRHIEQKQRCAFVLMLKLPNNLLEIGIVADVAVLLSPAVRPCPRRT